MTTLTLLAYILLFVIVVAITLITFAMNHVAGHYDDVSEIMYQKELEKINRSKEIMESIDDNPEYIERNNHNRIKYNTNEHIRIK